VRLILRGKALSTVINEYLENVKSNLRLDDGEEDEVLSELASHIEDEVQDLKTKGLKEDEAVNASLKLLGSAKHIAVMIYESHSQGTWRQALTASLPHLLFGLIFILNSWRGIGALLMALIGILAITVYGWWHGKSNWLFPWLGYSFLPVIAAGLALLYLPEGLDWLAILIYLPLILWLIFRVVSHTIKKDWIYWSLMLLPMPAIIAWFAVTDWKNGFNINSLLANDYATLIGFSFLALAFGVISFVRIRRRWLKIAVLFITGSIVVVLVSSYALGGLTLNQFLLLLLLQASIFLIPAFLENGARSGRWGKIFENHPMSR
jgi:hypothetical protein